LDRLDDLLVLVEVVDSGSLTTAGQRLGLSPSAISRRLADLETRLGARLINRTTRRIALTEIGASFCHRARAILAALNEAELAVGEMNQSPQGLLRLSLPVMFGQLHVTPLLPGFLKRHPQVSVEVGLTDRPVRLIEDGVDIAVRIGRLADSSLIARRLAPVRQAVLAAPAYLAAHGTPECPADLVRHSCLAHITDGTRQDWQFMVEGREETIRVSGCLQSDSMEVLRQAAVSGAGLIRLPTFVTAAELKSGALLPVLNRFEARDTSVFALYPATRHLTPKVRTFVDYLSTVITQPAYWWRHELSGTDESAQSE